jgi:hypothetical protein
VRFCLHVVISALPVKPCGCLLFFVTFFDDDLRADYCGCCFPPSSLPSFFSPQIVVWRNTHTLEEKLSFSPGQTPFKVDVAGSEFMKAALNMPPPPPPPPARPTFRPPKTDELS